MSYRPERVTALGMAAAFITLALVLIGAAKMPSSPPPELAWAYPMAPAKTPVLNTPAGTYSTPDGKSRLSAAAVDRLSAADKDWFPHSHPAPPAVILRGTDAAYPCAECHMVNGQGIVGIPDLGGLPAIYIFEQVMAFRAGTRTSAQPGRMATAAMTQVAKVWSDKDISAAAAYYASLPRRSPVKVVVTETAPPMRMERWGWTYRDPAGGHPRPLNGSVAEAPDSVAKVFMGDPSNRQIVYASRQTLAAGAALIRSGGSGGQPCALCHGSDLRGTASAPPLAGRDPGYLARQLWDIRSGARIGPDVAAMQIPVKGLSPRDITAVSAYLASRAP